MEGGVTLGLILVGVTVFTTAFCLVLYPPISEKLKKVLELKDLKNYENAESYSDLNKATRSINLSNIMTGFWYAVYFFIATQYLVFRFGSFAYGDNDETCIYLFWVGIPYMGCYMHFCYRIGMHRLSLIKSNLKNQENDTKVFLYTFSIPMVLLIVVQKIFHFSAVYPDRNIFLLLMGLK